MPDTKKTAYNVIITTVCLILLSVFFSFSLIYSLFAAIVYILFVLKRKDYPIKELIKNSLRDSLQYRDLYITISFIGAIVSMWLASGAIASMIYYGFNYIVGVNFLLFSFLIVGASALFIGSAVGTFSTIGLILYSIGTVIGIPQAILVGSIVSGSFIADKISPISGLIVIGLDITKTKYNKTLEYSARTMLPAIGLSSIIYYFLGKNYIILEKTSKLIEIQNQLQSSFQISPLLFIIPLIILAMSIFGFKSLQTIASGVLAGIIFSIFLQGYSPIQVLKFLIFGFRLDPQNPLYSLLKGGGLLNILDVVLIIMCAIFLIHILINSGMIDLIVGQYVQNIHSPRQLIQKTGILSMLLTILTCDQTVGIFLPVKLLIDKYDSYRIKREVLFRTISDTGIVIAPLIPWNINYLIIIGTLGQNINYIPYAVFCYISPLLALLSSFLYAKNPDAKGSRSY